MNPLLEVLTPSEVAHMWYLRVDTVRKAIFTRRNPLEARKAGHNWLITYQSCVQRWGQPARTLSIN